MPRSNGTRGGQEAGCRLVPGPCLLHFRAARGAAPKGEKSSGQSRTPIDLLMQVLPHKMQELLPIGRAELLPASARLQIQPLSGGPTRHGTCFSKDVAIDPVGVIGSTREV